MAHKNTKKALAAIRHTLNGMQTLTDDELTHALRMSQIYHTGLVSFAMLETLRREEIRLKRLTAACMANNQQHTNCGEF